MLGDIGKIYASDFDLKFMCRPCLLLEQLCKIKQLKVSFEHWNAYTIIISKQNNNFFLLFLFRAIKRL